MVKHHYYRLIYTAIRSLYGQFTATVFLPQINNVILKNVILITIVLNCSLHFYIYYHVACTLLSKKTFLVFHSFI